MSETFSNISTIDNLPEVIDLFSGCGGLSLGFRHVGFNVTHGIELSKDAVETASYNLHWRYGEESNHVCKDITQADPDDIVKSIGTAGCIVIGGPPCQAYSLIGRAKLKSLGEDRENTNDRRGFLYQDFLRFVYALNARAVVMENVPEATDFGGKNVPDIVCGSLKRHGYIPFWTILNSADYGVPQIRERVILIAVRETEKIEIKLPIPTNCNQDNSRIAANESRFKNFAEQCKYFTYPQKSLKSMPDWVTVGDAFSDLPELFPNEHTVYRLEKITTPMKYHSEPQNSFQVAMRTWFGPDKDYVTGNCFRKYTRDFPIFARMKQGDDYSDASRIADELLQKACTARGITSINSKAYEDIKSRIVPPYDRENFVAKWQRLCLDKPSYTLVAHLSVDTYSHIHPTEPRGISVREAARLQSFPDDFLIQCSMGAAYKQIGNAVPPLMAVAVAKCIKDAFLHKEES